MQMIKKPLSILLSLILVFSVFTVVPVATAGTATTQVFARKWVAADHEVDDYFSFTDLYQNFVVCRVQPDLFDETNFSTTQTAVYNKTADMSLGYGNEIRLQYYSGSEMRYYWKTDQSTSGNGKIYLSTNGDSTNFNTDGMVWYAYTWETFEAEKVDAVAPTCSNGVYTNGTSEYYTCGDRLFAPIEGTTDGHQNVKQISSTDELAVPYFEFSDNGEQLSGYNGTDAEITLPETIPENYPVAEWQGKSYSIVKNEAFKGNQTLTKVTMPDNVVHIGVSAFEGCSNLLEAYAGSRLEYIDTDAFKGCERLTKFRSATPYAEDEHHSDQLAFYDDYGTPVTIYCRHGSFLAANVEDELYDHVQLSYIDYTITWNNLNGDELEQDQYVLEGETPTYDSATPIRRNSDHTIYTFTGWDPEVAPVTGDATYTAAFSGRSDTKTATYIDESGEEQTVTATILGGTEQYEYYDQTFTYFLGEEGQTTWYVVEDDVIYDESLDAPIRIKGNVNLIIEDGASLKADYLSTPHTDESRSLTVYGQTEQSGAFTVDYVDRFYQFDALNIYGATNNFGSVTRVAEMNVKRGTLSVSGSVAVETVTLGCATENDSITIGAIHEDCESVSIEDGQTLIDDIREYTGVLTADDIAAMAGKTLVKAHSHSVNTLTHHAAVAPTYNSAVNTYTGGTVEHYDCSICGGHFVLEDGQLAEKTDEELVVLYFVFQGNPIPGYTDQCWVLEYNGTDADVIIPDTVPADYPDEAQRGNTVTGIDHEAFKGKTTLVSVTTGDGCRGIYESAFEGCTSLKTVTVGSSLSHIGTDAFKGCAALERFTSTSTENITYSHIEIPEDPENPEQPAINEYSFDTNTTVDFFGPHGSTLYAIAKDFNCDFIPTDRHPDPTWEWAHDYSGATAHFKCNGCPYTDDISADSVVTQDGGLAIYDVSVTTDDGYTYTDRRTGSTMWVDYIDKDGNDAYVEANIVTGSEAYFGEPGKTTWYVVNGDVNFGDLDMVLAGDTNIILANGAKLAGIRDINSSSEEEPESEDDKPKLYIFGQYGQDGRLEAGNIDSDVSMISYGGSLKANVIKSNYILWRGYAKTMEVKSAVLVVNSGAMEVDNSLMAGSVVVAGGSLKANFIEISDPAGILSIFNGSLYVNYVFVCGDTYFTGGTTTVADKAKVANITIGCNSQNDSITVGQYEFLYDDYTMTVVPDEMLFDGLNTYTGTVTREEVAAMAGKRVVLAHEHTDADMTRKAATNPTYDPATGKYTDGNTEYYTCNKCDGCFVKDGDDYVAVAPESVVVPYFRYTLDSDSDGTSCILSEYNGQDADIVIPDTVPDNYPDEALRGNTVTEIDRIAFRDNTTITSVTAGDELKIIGSKAFKDCTELKSVTVGNGLEWIQSGAFERCTELESFTSSAHRFTYVYGDQHRPNSFDKNAEIVFHGPHGGTLLEISQRETKWSFIPTDRHQDPTWTWAADYSSATAAFNCNGACQLANGYEVTDSDIEAAETDMGTQYTASVTLDGETYTETKLISYWKTLQADINAAADGTATTITLAHDCTALADDTALIIPADKIITIDLNGHTIDRNLESAVENGNVITNNGTLSLVGADGTITGGKNTANGGAIVNNGTLNITGTTITGNVTEKDGGAVYNSGTVNFESGTMSYNSAGKYSSGSGGALSAHSGTININSNNCYIDNNTAEGHGGAIYLGTKDGNTATLNLNGGWITENSAGNQGGGILHNGILNVQGRPYVKGNTAENGNNIYLRPNKLINVSDTLLCDNDLGVTREDNITGVITSNLANQGLPRSFFSDNENYYITNNGSGEATLQRYYVLNFDNNGGSGIQNSIKSTTSSIELPDCTFDAPEGKVFKAWNVGGTEMQPGNTVTITSGYTMTATAVWAVAYHIEIEDEIINGTVSADAEYAAEGQTVTLTVTPGESYVLQELYVVAAGTNPIILDPEASDFSFTMPAQDVVIHAYFAKGTAYVDAKGNDMPAKIAQELVSSDTEWGGSVSAGETTSWYYAEGEVTINDRVTVTGNVNLILCDGATLTIPKGIKVAKGTGLTIWQQKGGTGHLVIEHVADWNAAIGSNRIGSGTASDKTAGSVTINGGILDVVGGYGAAAIGGGSGGCSGGTITINGGKVNARSVRYGAAIGGGWNGKAGSVTINGGTVNATAYMDGAAIGQGAGADLSQPDSVMINGGTVRATIDPQGTSSLSVMNGSTFTLNYDDESKYTMSVMAESWSGTVKLSKTFVDEDGASYAAQTVSDNSILDGKTLRPAFDRFAKHSLTLNGDIGVNFYLDLSEVEISQGAVVDFKLNGEDLSSYTVRSTDKYAIDGKTYYKATCWVCAPEMADTITAEVKVNGETVAAEDYSVKTYGDTFLSDAYKTTFLEKGHTLDEYNKLAALVQTMLNYGAYTQIQFSEENAGSNPNNNTTHDAENLANADINYDLTPLTENEINAIEMSAPNKEAMNAKLSGTGLTYYGYTMLLHSETKLRFYFIKGSKNTDITGIHLSRDGVTYDAQNYNAKYAFVEVPAIPAYELNYSYTLTVGEENLGSYSALTYVKDVLENSPDDTTLRNTVTAMYRYHMAAVEWFNNN